MLIRSLGQEDNLEKGRAACSSILAWTIPWTEEPGSPQGHKELDTTGDLAQTHSAIKEFSAGERHS